MIDTVYRCEICDEESEKPIRWMVIHCSDAQLTIFKWTKEAADKPNARHYCGEAHAQVYISRWFQSLCGQI
jgi:DNA-directed RNA polymerase subunit RPC12/RpoP